MAIEQLVPNIKCSPQQAALQMMPLSWGNWEVKRAFKRLVQKNKFFKHVDKSVILGSKNI